MERNRLVVWKRTVAAAFENTTSLYPCFHTARPLRDLTEIVAVAGTSHSPLDSQQLYQIMFALYVIVVSSGLSSLTIFVVKANQHARRL